MRTEYPQDLSQDDLDAGFQLQEIDNPEGQAETPPRLVRAVVRQLQDWERVVKASGPGGRVVYRRQVHGVWVPPAAGDVPTWKACGDHSDPHTAVSPEARQGDMARLGRSIVTSPPAISRDHAT